MGSSCPNFNDFILVKEVKDEGVEKKMKSHYYELDFLSSKELNTLEEFGEA